MTDEFIPFDEARRRVEAMLNAPDSMVDVPRPLYVVRDLFGRIRLSASDAFERDECARTALDRLAASLHDELGPRGHGSDDGVLFTSDALLETLDDTARRIDGLESVYWADRLVTGRGWWTVRDAGRGQDAKRIALFSVKGGVGRSTSAAVLAWHLARRGERVLVADLDLESPGLSSAMLDPRARPEFGIADWFVEELIGHGARAIDRMTAAPAWASDIEGDVLVAPAHGADPGEYLAKLGRVYMDTADDPWTARLERLLGGLEAAFEPTVVLIESRSGLHDIAAATVTDLDADVLLFATDSDSGWTDCGILFRHWQEQGLAAEIRERLSIVSALTPELDAEPYLRRFRARAWDLFRDRLYDGIDPSDESGDAFSFALADEGAPHDPFVIHWNRGFAAGASLQNPAEAPVALAYGAFLDRFDRLVADETAA